LVEKNVQPEEPKEGGTLLNDIHTNICNNIIIYPGAGQLQPYHFVTNCYYMNYINNIRHYNKKGTIERYLTPARIAAGQTLENYCSNLRPNENIVACFSDGQNSSDYARIATPAYRNPSNTCAVDPGDTRYFDGLVANLREYSRRAVRGGGGNENNNKKNCIAYRTSILYVNN
jgi:hypothetical protein